MTMLTDGLKSQSLEDKIAQMDVAELLEKSCSEEVLILPPITPHVHEHEQVAASAEE